MSYFSNFSYRLGGKILTVRSVQIIATLAAALLAMTVGFWCKLERLGVRR
jgi:hypothetical protein